MSEKKREEKEELSFRTYRECNYPIVVPFFCVGFEDFIVIFLGIMIAIFGSAFLKGVLPPFLIKIFVFICVFVSLFCFWIARSEYKKKGRVNVLFGYLDYYLSEREEVIDGREKKKKFI